MVMYLCAIEIATQSRIVDNSVIDVQIAWQFLCSVKKKKKKTLQKISLSLSPYLHKFVAPT